MVSAAVKRWRKGKNSVRRRAYKGFGLIDDFRGQFFYPPTQGKLNASAYETVLTDVCLQWLFLSACGCLQRSIPALY